MTSICFLYSLDIVHNINIYMNKKHNNDWDSAIIGPKYMHPEVSTTIRHQKIASLGFRGSQWKALLQHHGSMVPRVCRWPPQSKPNYAERGNPLEHPKKKFLSGGDASYFDAQRKAISIQVKPRIHTCTGKVSFVYWSQP